MLCANMEGTSLRGCNFEDPAGSRANMEGKDIVVWHLFLPSILQEKVLIIT